MTGTKYCNQHLVFQVLPNAILKFKDFFKGFEGSARSFVACCETIVVEVE